MELGAWQRLRVELRLVHNKDDHYKYVVSKIIQTQVDNGVRTTTATAGMNDIIEMTLTSIFYSCMNNTDSSSKSKVTGGHIQNG